MGKRSQAEVEKLTARAFKLLTNGHKQSEVAQKLNISLRTLQRWIANEKSPTSDNSPVEKLNLSPETIETNINSPKIKSSLLDELNNILNGQRNCHREMWEALKQKFDDEVHQPEPSVRNLNNLSLAIDRHMQGEFRSACQGKQDLMTFQQAFKLLESNGYSIIPQSRNSEFYESTSEKQDVI